MNLFKNKYKSVAIALTFFSFIMNCSLEDIPRDNPNDPGASNYSPDFTVGGTVTGLSGGEYIVLQLNDGNDLSIFNDGNFAFSKKLSDQSAYIVAIAQQPATKTCSISGEIGTVNGENITTVAILCETLYNISGTLSGLPDGDQIELLLSSTADSVNESLVLPGNGPVVFTSGLTDASDYSVSVTTQPLSGQTCTVTGGSNANGTGNIAAGDVSDIVVDCPPLTYLIGGVVSGLTSDGLVLQNNAGDNLTVAGGSTTFQFATQVTGGNTYDVTILTQPSTPTAQTCSVSNGSGTVSSADVDSVSISCSTNTYAVKANVSGLAGTGLVLQNGADSLSVGANGTVTFATAIPDGASYNVSVQTNPSTPSQNCSVVNGSGTVPLLDENGVQVGDVSNLDVNCTTNTYTIGGTVSGYDGAGLVLLNNAGDALPINGNGSFTFATPLTDLSSYAVAVDAGSTVTNPYQTCNVTNGTGNLAGANVTNVTVACTTNTYTVGGNISGTLGGENLSIELRNLSTNTQLQAINNISATGGFTFNAQPSGTAWIVNVTSTTGALNCSASSNSGVIAGDPINTVSINCSLTTYSIQGTLSGLSGSGLVLQNNGGDDLAVSADGIFTFGTPVAEGGSYNVTVKTHPSGPLQLCSVSNASGTNIMANVTNVSVSCVADNPPVASLSTNINGSYTYVNDIGATTASASSDDGGIASYQYFLTTSACSFPTGTTSSNVLTQSYSPAVDCNFDAATHQAIIQAGIKVRVTDTRGQSTDSGYVYFYIFSPDYTYVKQGGSSYGLDPDYPAGSIQTAVTYADSYGKTNVAVQSGTYTASTATAVTMIPGISVYGNYNSTWTSRSIQSAATVLNHTYTGTGSGYGFYMSGSSFTTATALEGIALNEYSYGNRYGFYVNGGSPVIRYNTIKQAYQTGTYILYGIYCTSCSSRIEANLIDVDRGYGLLIYYTTPQVYNNVIRSDYYCPIGVYYTGTNYVSIINNTLINTYTSKSYVGAAVRMYGASTSPVSRVRFYNNIMYGQYGIYEASTYADPIYIYNNDFYGPAGYSAYYDADGSCTTNYDGDGSSNTCNVTDVNVAPYPSLGYNTANISVNPGHSAQTATNSLINANMTSADVNMRYGARYWSSITTDWYQTTRSSNNPTTGGSTLSGAYGWSIGADED